MNAVPVIFLNPRTNLVDAMPLEMVSAYIPNGTELNLEEAARVAFCRDEEAAINLLESAVEMVTIPEGTITDFLSVESPSLR